MKTSPLKLKFTPDWDPAGDEYSRAATAFKVAKDFEQSKKCLLKAVDCYKEVHSIFQAGKMLEQAVLCSRDMGQLEDVASLAERGALMYRQVAFLVIFIKIMYRKRLYEEQSLQKKIEKSREL